MNKSLRFPWGGDVVQSINPWDFWVKSVSSQLGFINVKNVMSTDNRIEQEIIEDVASYGRQLGQIADVLKVLIKHQAMEDLKPGEKQAVSRFEKMASEIDHVKKKWKTPEKLLSELETVLSQIRELKPDYPDTYEIAIAKIKNEIKTFELESNIKIKSVIAKNASSKRAHAQSQSIDIAASDISQSTEKATIVTSQKKKKDLGRKKIERS